MSGKSLNLALVGVGGWGQNLLRNLAGLKNSRLKYACDLDAKKLQAVCSNFPGVETTSHYSKVLEDPEVDAVFLATDAPSHFALGRDALKKKKHLFVEKPLTLSSKDAEELGRLAKESRVFLAVGHLLLHHPAISFLRGRIREGELGDLRYIYTLRLNLGIVREKENAWWSLAPHDISVILDLFGSLPRRVSAHGARFIQKEVEDVVFANLSFPDGKMAQIHVSWLDPHKMRKITVVGSKKMVVFDDMEATEKIRVYNKSAHYTPGYASFHEGLTLQQGEVMIPSLQNGEPLRLECQRFVDSIREGKEPEIGGAQSGRDVVKVLEAGQRSLENGGVPVTLE